MVTDEQFLNGLKRCKELGALAMVHAENGDAVAMGQEAVIAAGITAPHGHGLSRPAVLEGEATGRAIRLASFVNTPLYVVHVMSIDALDQVRCYPPACPCRRLALVATPPLCIPWPARQRMIHLGLTGLEKALRMTYNCVIVGLFVRIIGDPV